MNKRFYIKTMVWLLLGFLGPLSMSAQCITRTVTDCKISTPNDAIGWAMKDFFQDGSTPTWNWEAGASWSECADGTATLTGVIKHYANPTSRRFQVSINFSNRSCTLPTGMVPERNNLPTGTSTANWYYQTLSSGTLTGLNDLAGARLTLSQHMMPSQAGVGGANQFVDAANLGLTGWFEWAIQTQPSNGWLLINNYPAGPALDQADICILLGGTPPSYCPVTDPCVANPVPTPTTTITNATNGQANGCINITNLPTGAKSSINGGTATVGKTQYCGLAAGTYTITVNLNGCIKSVTCKVGNTVTPPAPCQTQTSQCLTATLLSITSSASTGTKTFNFKLTNSCQNGLSNAAFSLPNGVVAVSPKNNYTSPNGRTYLVENPATQNPFYGIKFNANGSGVANGGSDIFSFTLAAGVPVPSSFNVAMKAATVTYTVSISTSGCTYTYALANTALLTAQASAETNRSFIEWVNNTGMYNDYFKIEKMNPATGIFETLTTVNSTVSDVVEHYSAFDEQPTEGENRYQVTVVLNDGSTKKSDILTVNFKNLSSIRVFPNPANDYLDLDLTTYKGENVAVFMYNKFGQQVIVRQIEQSRSTLRLDVSTQSVGNYLIRITAKGKKDVLKKVNITH